MRNNTETIKIEEEAQIGMYAGSMYFKSETEQNDYCGFMGLIPLPRTEEQEKAFGNGIVRPNGFVLSQNHQYNESISRCVSQCKFEDCPIDLAIKLIEAHHQTLIKESHVASIFDRGIKLPIENHKKQ